MDNYIETELKIELQLLMIWTLEQQCFAIYI